MRIIQLVTSRQYRGAEVFAAELSSQLGLKGHEITFVGLYTPNENILTAANSYNIDLNGKRSSFSIRLFMRVLKLIKKQKPEIIQANGSDTLKYAVISKFFFPRVKIVYRNISIVSSWAGKNYLKKKVNTFLFSKVDRITSVGEKAAADLVITYKYPPLAIKVISRGVPSYTFDRQLCRDKIVGEFSIEQPEFILLHVGNFSAEKNHRFLITCFEEIIKELPSAKMLFLGEGDLYGEIKKVVEAKNLSLSIFMPGLKTNIQEYAAGCDLFLLGSIIEGVPGVVMEAAMQKIPTVAVNVGGIGEVVLNGHSGVLINKHHPKEFSDAVCSLLKQPVVLKQMGTVAQQFVKQQYSVKSCTENFEKLYAEIISNEN